MKNVIIKDGKIYSESFGKVDVFEIVDKIPTGFFVWNIGDNMGHDEYIPVCQDLRPGDKDCFEINTRALKAIKLNPEEVQLLRKAAGYGVNSKETAEKALRCKRKGRMSEMAAIKPLFPEYNRFPAEITWQSTDTQAESAVTAWKK